MKGFVRTIFILFGLVGLLLISAAIASLVLLRDQELVGEKLRSFILSPDDVRWLSMRDELGDEMPVADPEAMSSEVNRTFRRLADRINEGTVRELVEQLSQRQAELRERAAYLDQREAELRLHKAELVRLEQRFADRKGEVERLLQRLEEERERWARAKIEEQRHLKVLREVEREQWQRVAQRYELMKQPWDLLRELQVDEIAMILALMQGKKAAKILDTATRDPASQDLPVQIHRRLLDIDVDGLSQDQAKRLAGLYDFMKADQVVVYLGGSPPEEIAEIVDQMDLKKGKGVLESLQRLDPDRAVEVQRLLQPDGGAR